MLKNIEKAANQNAVNQNYTGDLGTQVGVNYGTINLTTTGKEFTSVKISDEALQILSEMAEDPTGTLTAIMMLGGFMFQTNHKNFGAERNDTRKTALLSGIIDELEQYGLIKANSPKREMFSITRDGFNVADKLQKNKLHCDRVPRRITGLFTLRRQ
jgi:arginyl-tRNA synthetase